MHRCDNRPNPDAETVSFPIIHSVTEARVETTAVPRNEEAGTTKMKTLQDGKLVDWRRTHTCGELRKEEVGKSVTLNGWVNTYRDQGSLIFIDLRDRYGITQVVFSPQNPELLKSADQLRSEFVVAVRGVVAARLEGKENLDHATGQIEVKATELQILNRCPTPPFEVTEFAEQELAGEDLRLQYRYLDLRRASLQKTLMLRHRLNKVIRDYLDEQDFLELETPLLGKSTPEGARDYLVPSRIFEGHWYALPQSPQLYKQLLMVSGYDKYFQIARCLRDEDLRADRQPEFTQLDLEMSFVDLDDVFGVIEGLTVEVFKQCLGVDIEIPLPRLSLDEAMLRFGNDKPDMRYEMEISDIGDLAVETEFKVFQSTLDAGGKVRGLCAKGAAEKFSRKGLDELTDFVKQYGARGWPGSRWTRTSSLLLSRNSCPLTFNKGCVSDSKQSRATCCYFWRTPKRWCASRFLLSGSTWRASWNCSTPAPSTTRSCGLSTSLPSIGTQMRRGGSRTITPSRLRARKTFRSWTPIQVWSGPRHTTWSSTATSAAAGAFVFTTRRCRPKCLPRSA